MRRGYWYVVGKDGRHYCFNKGPSYRCPVGDVPRQGSDDPQPGSSVVSAVVAQAADLLEVSGTFLAARLRHSPERARRNGKLTENCAACGHRLERLGFRCWIEGPPPTDASENERTNPAIRKRLQGTSFVTVEGSWYRKSKKEAQEWAHLRAGENR